MTFYAWPLLNLDGLRCVVNADMLKALFAAKSRSVSVGGFVINADTGSFLGISISRQDSDATVSSGDEPGGRR